MKIPDVEVVPSICVDGRTSDITIDDPVTSAENNRGQVTCSVIVRN